MKKGDVHAQKFPKVSIIVINFRGTTYLNNCLNSLRNIRYPDFEIIVVDCLTSNISQYIERFFPTVKLVHYEKDIGAAAQHNAGVKVADKASKYILFLDNDVEVHPDLLFELVSLAESQPNIGVVGPRVMSLLDRKTELEAGLKCDLTGFPLTEHTNSMMYSVFYVSSCCMLVRKEVFEHVTGFDPEYFLFVDDLDFCWRVRLVGYDIKVTKKAIVYHKGGGTAKGGHINNILHYETSTQRIYFRERNTLRTLLKNYALTNLLFSLLLYLTTLVFEFFIFSVLTWTVPKCYIHALTWNIKKLRDTLRVRSIIQRNRKVKDSEIMKFMLKFGFGKFQFFKVIGIPRVKNEIQQV